MHYRRQYMADWHRANNARETVRIGKLESARRAKAADPDGYAARKHEAWARRKEAAAANRQDWRERNRERARELSRSNQARRKARQLAATADPVDYAAILAVHGMVCHICGGQIESRADLHFDHVIPLAALGPHHPDNIRPAHARCNMRKGARSSA